MTVESAKRPERSAEQAGVDCAVERRARIVEALVPALLRVFIRERTTPTARDSAE